MELHQISVDFHEHFHGVSKHVLQDPQISMENLNMYCRTPTFCLSGRCAGTHPQNASRTDFTRGQLVFYKPTVRSASPTAHAELTQFFVCWHMFRTRAISTPVFQPPRPRMPTTAVISRCAHNASNSNIRANAFPSYFSALKTHFPRARSHTLMFVPSLS